MVERAFSNRQNSTNGRSHRPRRLLRWALGVLSRVTPGLAVRAVSKLFLLVPRVPRPRGEAAAFLESGEPLSIPWRGRRLAAWSWGSGPAILLVHGWGGRGTQMRAFVRALVSAGYRAVVLDAPAHGFSGGRSTSLPEYADAITTVARATEARAVVAHSFGGASALLALSRGLALSRVVALAAPSSAERIWGRFVRALGLPRGVAEGARQLLERGVGTTFSSLKLSAYASRIRVPVLVIHDRNDEEVPFAAGEEIARLLPTARLVATEGLGHRRLLRDGRVVGMTVRFLEEGIAPDRCAACRRARGTAGTAALCGDCVLGRDLFERDRRSAA
jgi:pimeloyl-ACP methyl ester carboxylesterase